MTNRVTRQLDDAVWRGADRRISSQVDVPVFNRGKRYQYRNLDEVLCCQEQLSFIETFRRGLEPHR